jgi:DNA topoisomerase-1
MTSQGAVAAKQKRPIFDTAKAKEICCRGRRAKWWRRLGKMGKGFRYVDCEGKAITDPEQLERIKSLVIPPAWRHVRISPFPNSSLQAVGMDTTGRVQYKYHPKFSEKQQRKKFEKIERFGEHLPKLRKTTNEHLALEGFPRDKVLAIMMRLINSLYIRVGTEQSVRHYKTYGITTLKNNHLSFGRRRGELVFEFVGKSHKKHRKVLVDHELATMMQDLKALGGSRKLFHYVDENGQVRPVKPAEINEYLKAATAPEFTSKDFRTWGGTLLAAVELSELGKPEDEKDAKKKIVRVVKSVAEQLGNTPSVCRSSYIHPAVIKSYENGITLDEFRPRRSRRVTLSESEYEPEEKALIKLLRSNGRS